jgi:predicted Ser/Thr protein kinase
MALSPETSLFLSLQAALAGRYSLERELGRGGMGVVFLARDVRLDRPVALKLLPPERAEHQATRERFLSEARMAARLSHPNIVPIHAVEEIGGFVFFAMQYVAGETLGHRLRRGGKMPPWEAARILRDVAWALSHAHAQHVVHRDIKPDNILMDRDGRALVADFGIARLADAEQVPGRIQGTPEYLSPEQAGGQSCDARADLYSLGAVAFHALTGQPPFVGDTSQLIAQHLTRTAPLLLENAPDLPPRLAAAVDRALLKDPEQRWPDAGSMAEAFAPPLPMTADLPVPVRIWAERGREMKGLYVVWSLLFYGLATMVFTVASVHGWPLGAVIAFGFFLMAIPVPWAGHALWRLVETRRVLEAGATIEDLRHASEVTRARREEELRFDATRPIHWLPRTVRVATYGMFAIAASIIVGSGLLGIPFFNSPAFLLFALSTLMGIAGALKGLLIPGRRVKPVDPWARGRAWFWRSPFGKVFAKVAATGLPKHAAWADWRPTEAALGNATETLYAALPSQQQQALLDLPNVVSRLEHEAAFARTQLERDVEGPWAARLEAAVGAIETLRLGLLRLHVQQGEAGSLTADLDAARDLAARIDYAVSAEAEVRGLLDQSRHQNNQAQPSASPPTTSLG